MVTAIDSAFRAERAWALILRKPASVIFTKPQVTLKSGITPPTALAAQTVRVVSDNRASTVEGESGAAPTRAVIIYGVKGHPLESVVDTDINEGYTCLIDGDRYRVTEIILVPGGVQALARVWG